MPRTTGNMTAWINDKIVHDVTLNVHVEPVEITQLGDTMGPDPTWSLTDAFGHYHATSKEENEPWPTLERDYVSHGDPDDPDYIWTTVIFKCRICGQPIEPPMVVVKPAPTFHEYEPGRKSWGVGVRTLHGSLRALGTGDSVTFRALGEGHEVFGVAKIISISYQGLAAIEEIEMIGVGPLGHRDL